jgi:hypothetical protein
VTMQEQEQMLLSNGFIKTTEKNGMAVWKLPPEQKLLPCMYAEPCFCSGFELFHGGLQLFGRVRSNNQFGLYYKVNIHSPGLSHDFAATRALIATAAISKSCALQAHACVRYGGSILLRFSMIGLLHHVSCQLLPGFLSAGSKRPAGFSG